MTKQTDQFFAEGSDGIRYLVSAHQRPRSYRQSNGHVVTQYGAPSYYADTEPLNQVDEETFQMATRNVTLTRIS